MSESEELKLDVRYLLNNIPGRRAPELPTRLDWILLGPESRVRTFIVRGSFLLGDVMEKDSPHLQWAGWIATVVDSAPHQLPDGREHLKAWGSASEDKEPKL